MTVLDFLIPNTVHGDPRALLLPTGVDIDDFLGIVGLDMVLSEVEHEFFEILRLEVRVFKTTGDASAQYSLPSDSIAPISI